MEKLHEFTSTGQKLFYHQEAMRLLRDGKGMPIVAHIMPTDICQHTCAFCSVATREGNILTMDAIQDFITQLLPLGLKAVIISGGGNPLLYKCPASGARIADVIEFLHHQKLDIGMITNGMPIVAEPSGRRVWKNLPGEVMDMLTWVRISMSGLDHKEKCVYVPDVGPNTTLGFSYVWHDIYHDPKDLNHGKVSTKADLKGEPEKTELAEDRREWLTSELKSYVERYNPAYLRLLPNCLEVDKIAYRCVNLNYIAKEIGPAAFVQYKPPMAPKACLLGYVHPVLNSDGYVYPCDSCVLNAAADHKFANPWRICHGSEIAELYNQPVRSLVDSKTLCPGCVFTKTNELLSDIRMSVTDYPVPEVKPLHVNFV